jgi:heme/copper-type cytochrome/quinol oxidase subunit 2
MNKRIIPFLVLATALSAGAVYFMFAVYNLPNTASVERAGIDIAIKTLISIAAVVFIWVVAAMAYVVTFNRRKQGDLLFGAPVTFAAMTVPG